jgi:hypothetical protein
MQRQAQEIDQHHRDQQRERRADRVVVATLLGVRLLAVGIVHRRERSPDDPPQRAWVEQQPGRRLEDQFLEAAEDLQEVHRCPPPAASAAAGSIMRPGAGPAKSAG